MVDEFELAMTLDPDVAIHAERSIRRFRIAPVILPNSARVYRFRKRHELGLCIAGYDCEKSKYDCMVL